MCRDKHYDPIPSQFEGLPPDDYFMALFKHEDSFTLVSDLAFDDPVEISVVEAPVPPEAVDPVQAVTMVMSGYAKHHYQNGLRRAEKASRRLKR